LALRRSSSVAMLPKRTICFLSYELHPTAPGGSGTLLHHAAELLLREGHRVVFLLDISHDRFTRFIEHDRLAFTNASNCEGYHVDTLCADFPYRLEEISRWSVWQSLRFAHALETLVRRGGIDFAEFHDYCGLGYYAMAQKLYERRPSDPVLGVR